MPYNKEGLHITRYNVHIRKTVPLMARDSVIIKLFQELIGGNAAYNSVIQKAVEEPNNDLVKE